jgi:hypothetical protein
MKSKIACILLLKVIILNAESNIHYQSIREKITIENETEGYRSEVSCKGVFNNDLGEKGIVIPFSELEKIKTLKPLYIKRKKKWDNVPSTAIELQSLTTTSSFYQGLKQYKINYKGYGTDFTYSYIRSSNHLITLSYLKLVEYPNSDTIIYEINVPRNYAFMYTIDSAGTVVKIDSVINDIGTKYTFISIPKFKVGTRAVFTNSYEKNNFVFPAMRILIIPKNKQQNGWSYLNKWFSELVAPNSKINAATKNKLNELIGKISNHDSIIKIVFDFVKTKIQYVAIENGLQAFIPRDVNSIFENKYGDCKDMANLLCQSLKLYGINAHIAIIGTLSYDYNMDFPSLYSANHAICVVENSDNTYFLDATEKDGIWNLPSRHTQGRRAFLTSDSLWRFLTTPIVDSKTNEVINKYEFYLKNDTLNGSFESRFSGLSQIPIMTYKNNFSKKDPIINNIFSKYTIESIDQEPDRINIKGKIHSYNKTLSTNNKNYLLLTFLPFPHELPRKANKNCSLLLYKTINNIYTFSIYFDKKIKIDNPKKYSFDKNGFVYHFDLTQIEDNCINITYYYKYNDVKIDSDNVSIYMQLNDLINESLNSSLIYE